MSMSKADIIHYTLGELIDNNVQGKPNHRMTELLGELYDIAEENHEYIGLKDKNGVDIRVGQKVKLCEKGIWYTGMVKRAVNGRYFVLLEPDQHHFTLEFKWGSDTDNGAEVVNANS
ncbi:hypothetical protein [Vibrio phage Artemius]|nr:hypothetical protein [Vibrio phage Artemius]